MVGAVARHAQVEGAKLTSQIDNEASTAAVLAWNRYNLAAPFERARLREQIGSATLELGQALVEAANDSRMMPVPVPPAAPPPTDPLVDRGVYEQHATLLQSGDFFRAASFHLANAAAIERGARVVVPTVAPAPVAPAPAPASPPNPQPDPTPPIAA